jgi:hypothetical protein
VNLRARLARRHRYNRQQIDLLGWPHPRPPRDRRIICLNVGLAWVSVVQIAAGPAPSSVQAQAFNYTATVAFAILMSVSALLCLYSAFCKSQYWSWGIELAGCVGFTFVFALYSVALALTFTDAYSSNSLAFALALCLGNGWRAAQLFPRLW